MGHEPKIHLIDTRNRVLCGLKGPRRPAPEQITTDINFVTCARCEAAHEAATAEPAQKPRVWADGFGVWHVRGVTTAKAAQKLVKAELTARGDGHGYQPRMRQSEPGHYVEQ